MTIIANPPYSGDSRYADIRAFLEMLYGPGTGYCHVVYGRGWYRNDAGKLDHRIWSERIGDRHAFRYPEQTDAIVAKILQLDATGADVYVCTGLMRTPTSRSKDNLIEGLWCLHADADHDHPLRIDVIRSVGWCAVGSGTAGHEHIYAPLSERIPGAQGEDLEDAMVDVLNADAKKRGNDVLRPPGTHNYKPTVDGGAPNPVVWSVRFSGARCDPRDVAGLLEVDLEHPKARSATKATRMKAEGTGGRAETEEFDLESFPQVQAAVTRKTGDRSDDTYRVMAVAYNAGLKFSQACWAVHQNPRLVERFDERREDDEVDLQRCWMRAIDARQSQVQQPPNDTLFDGDPIPLTSSAPIPPFPVDALPPQMATMAVAEATQTDPAMAGTSALSTLAAANGGAAQIRIRLGWCEPLNIHTVAIAAPGERKSAVHRAMTAPLYEAEGQLVEEGRAERSEADTRKQVAIKAAERRRQSAAMAAAGEPAKKGTPAGDPMQEAITAAREAEAIEVPAPPRLIADDITMEATASMLAEQGGRAAIISAEGGIFDIIAGRYSLGRANLDVLLKGHSGDELRVDRKGRPPEYIRAPALTIGLMIQPRVLSSIATNREFRGRGLLARFLYAWPTPMVGKRRIGTPVPPEIEKTYNTAMVALAKGMAAYVGKPATLRLSADAAQTLQGIEAAVEPTLAPDGELGALADWGAKYVGAIARLAGNLHMATYDPVTTALREPVSEQTVLNAARIGAYFKAGAINAPDQHLPARRSKRGGDPLRQPES